MFDYDVFMFQGVDVVGYYGYFWCCIGVEGMDIDVVDGNGFDWGFGQVDKGIGCVVNVMQFDVFDMDFVDCWGLVVYFGDCVGLYLVVVFIGIVMVKIIGVECGLDIIYQDVSKLDIGDFFVLFVVVF